MVFTRVFRQGIISDDGMTDYKNDVSHNRYEFYRKQEVKIKNL